MNIPNLLTIFRILLVPVFIIFIIYNRMVMALAVFILAGLTDGIDGLIARVFNQKTPLGAYLDPIADKLLLGSAFLALTLRDILPNWLTVIVISRDVIILGGVVVLSLMKKEVRVQPSVVSKATTWLQVITIILAILSLERVIFLEVVIWLTALFTIISGFQYIYRGVRLIG